MPFSARAGLGIRRAGSMESIPYGKGAHGAGGGGADPVRRRGERFHQRHFHGLRQVSAQAGQGRLRRQGGARGPQAGRFPSARRPGRKFFVVEVRFNVFAIPGTMLMEAWASSSGSGSSAGGEPVTSDELQPTNRLKVHKGVNFFGAVFTALDVQGCRASGTS